MDNVDPKKFKWKWIQSILNSNIMIENESLDDYTKRIQIPITDLNHFVDLQCCQICAKASELLQLSIFVFGLNRDLKSRLFKCSNIQSLEEAKLKLTELPEESMKMELDDSSTTTIWKLTQDKLSLHQNEFESPSEFSQRVKSVISNIQNEFNSMFENNGCPKCFERNELESLTWFLAGLKDELKSLAISRINEDLSLMDKVMDLANELDSEHDIDSPTTKRRKTGDSIQCTECPLKFESDSNLKNHCQSQHNKVVEIKQEDEIKNDQISAWSWIKRKRNLFIQDDETPQNFSIRVENLVMSAHHDFTKLTQQSEALNCPTCLKKNELECLQLFISGIDLEFQDVLEAKLETFETPKLSDAVAIVSQLSNPTNNKVDSDYDEDVYEEEEEEEEEEESDDYSDFCKVELEDIKEEEASDNNKAKFKFNCELCGNKFTRNSSLKRHVRLSHQEKKERPKTAVPTQESIEFEGLEYKKLAEPHNDIAELNENTYNEIWKELRAKYQSTVQTLDKSGNTVKMYNCEICSHNFVGHKDRLSHIFSVHRKLKRYRCLICNNYGNFALQSLTKHIKVVHEHLKKFKCDICETNFSTKHGRDSHVSLIHNKEKNSMCDTCGKSFSSEYSLKGHVESIHMNIKNVMCNICGKQFYDKAILKRHVQCSHVKAKADCPFCGATFAKSSLSHHIKSIHSNQPPVKCQLCNSTYRHFSSLRKHMKKNHPEHKFNPDSLQ